MTALSIDLNNISGADGYTIAIISFTTVFIALAVLIFIFKAISLILELKVRKKTNVLSTKQNMVPEDKVVEIRPRKIPEIQNRKNFFQCPTPETVEKI